MPSVRNRPSPPLVLIGDRLSPKPHLSNLVLRVRKANKKLAEGREIGYLVCSDYASFARALKQHAGSVRLIVVGPEIAGRQDTLARLLGNGAPVILAIDPDNHPLAETREESLRLVENLRDLGKIMVRTDQATEDFYEPIVRKHVVAGLGAGVDMASMTPEQRAEVLDRRLESVTAFPTLPETQRRVSALSDEDPPKKWAEAIDPDIPIRKVILNLLNSAHYGFRHRVETIEQAVSLASARAIREIVLACTVQKLFRRVSEARVDGFWQHSIAVAYFARLFALPVDAENSTPTEKAELERFRLDEADLERLRATGLADRFRGEGDVDPFTAGMLHDIGKVTMALCFEDSLTLIDALVSEGVAKGDERGEVWAESTNVLERSLMKDIDHAIIGGRIARRWDMDDGLVQVITRHHAITESTPPLVHLIGLADLAANALLPYPFEPEHAPLARLFAHVDATIAEAGGDPAEVARDTLQGDLAAPLESVLRRLDVPDLFWSSLDRTEFLVLCHRVIPAVRKLTLDFLRMTSGLK